MVTSMFVPVMQKDCVTQLKMFVPLKCFKIQTTPTCTNKEFFNRLKNI